MPAPLYTTNPNEFGQLEGLYIYELPPPGLIQGADRSAIGVTGQTVRGPVDTPVEITSPARFFEVFGGRDRGAGGAIVNEVWEFMLSKPWAKVVVVRAAAAAAATASFNLETDEDGTSGTECLKVSASSPGLWGNDVKVKVEAATDGDADHFNLRVSYLGAEKLYQNLDISATGTDNTLEVLGDDYGNWITLTKLADGVPITAGMSGLDSDGFINLGETVSNFTSVAGTEGSIADADYTGAGRALSKIVNYPDLVAVCVAKRANATINAALLAAAAASSDRMFPTWSGDHTDTKADVVTDSDDYRNERVAYCFNSPYITDPETGTEIQVPPHSFLASILSQTDVDQHVGSARTKAMTAAIRRLTYPSLARADYVDLRAAGVCAFERDTKGGFVFVSGVTTDLTAGRTEIARRRSADYLLISGAARLSDFVKELNTPENRAIMAAESVAWLGGLRDQGRIVEDFAVLTDADAGNTDTLRSAGQEFLFWQVRLFGHILHLVLKNQIGTGVEIEEQAAA